MHVNPVFVYTNGFTGSRANLTLLTQHTDSHKYTHTF